MKRYPIVLLLSLTAITSFPAFAEYQRVLSTPTRIIVVVVSCREGELECPDVSYVGVDRKSGDVTRLKGVDWVRHCAPDIPCQHLGFKFSSKEVDYYVSDDGELTVQSASSQTLASERGKWIDI